MSRLPIVGGDAGGWGAILNDWAQVAHSSGGLVLRIGTSGDTSRAITPGGQTNALSHQIQLPAVTSTRQYIGLTIESTGAGLGGGIIPLYVGNQTGTSTDRLWGLNMTLQQTAGTTTRQLVGVELNLNNNVIDSTQDANNQVGISVNSGGSKVAGVGYSVSGTAKFIDALLVQQGSISSGGFAYRYNGTTSNSGSDSVTITQDGKLQMGFRSGIGSKAEYHTLNNTNLSGLNAPQTLLVPMICVSTVSGVLLSPGGTQIQWGPTNTALGGGAAATLGTVGAAGPPSAAQKEWMPVQTSSGAQRWIPVWSSS